jgi:hypothetical protein
MISNISTIRIGVLANSLTHFVQFATSTAASALSSSCSSLPTEQLEDASADTAEAQTHPEDKVGLTPRCAVQRTIATILHDFFFLGPVVG